MNYLCELSVKSPFPEGGGLYEKKRCRSACTHPAAFYYPSVCHDGFPCRGTGFAPSGSVSAALTSIPSASQASGPEPAVHATIPPSWQSTGGERHALPVPGLDIPGDVRGPLLVRGLGGEVTVGEVAGRGRGLAFVGAVAPTSRHVRRRIALRLCLFNRKWAV